MEMQPMLMAQCLPPGRPQRRLKNFTPLTPAALRVLLIMHLLSPSISRHEFIGFTISQGHRSRDDHLMTIE